MAPASPGIFRVADPSNIIANNASAVFANTAWLVTPESLALALQIPRNCSTSGINTASICGQVARAGDVFQVYSTGLGKATAGGDPGGAVLPPGAIAPANGDPLYKTIETPVVTVGGVPSAVLFSGLAPGFAGLYQLNIRVPAGAPTGDQVALRIATANGLSDAATIAIQP